MRKYHFPFIDLDKEEAWINRCVRQGWRLKDVNIFIYEFIPQKELDKSLADPGYQPSTVLWDQVTAGEIYEIVLTVLKGGAFARYRVGDMFRCTGASFRYTSMV